MNFLFDVDMDTYNLLTKISPDFGMNEADLVEKYIEDGVSALRNHNLKKSELFDDTDYNGAFKQFAISLSAEHQMYIIKLSVELDLKPPVIYRRLIHLGIKENMLKMG
jgi:hypothetical protein